MVATTAAGWYGKLPSLGDFASRRLDHDFIDAWDHWLAAGLAGWREREPADWLQRYLHGPSWRFLLMPGVLRTGSQADATVWAGVLMPSVDRVGRYFPLTLALPLPELPASSAQAEALLNWLHGLDDIALDALEEDWSADQLEAELARLGALPTPAPVPVPVPVSKHDETDATGDPGLATLLPELLSSSDAQALWICSDANGQPQWRVTAGLPSDLDFESLLGALLNPPEQAA